MDVVNVEFRNMDPLTPNHWLQVITAKRVIGEEDEVVEDTIDMVDIDDVKGIIENRVREYVLVVMDFVVVLGVYDLYQAQSPYIY